MSAWQAHTSEDGRTYYYNSETLESKWDKPEELLTPLERALAASKWKEYTAEGGAKYWYNEDTEESVWEIPEEINSILKSSEENATNGVGNDEYEGHTITSAGTSASSGPNVMADYFKYSTQSKVAPGKLTDVKSEEESTAAFKQMLSDFNIDDTYGWASAMKLVVCDPRYWAIPYPLERKRVFDEFIVETKHERQEQRRQARENQLKEMTMALSKYPEIKYYTKWRTVKEKLATEDPIFKEVDDPKLRHYAFHVYVKKLRQAYEAKQARERETAIERLGLLLNMLEVSASSRWLETLQLIKASPKFTEDARLNSMPREDILAAYSNYIREKDYEVNDERQKVKKLQRRRERHIREAFVELLQDLHKAGKIKAGTRWVEIRSLFEKDPRYTDICGQPGSTPLELFWDIVEEEGRKLRLQREQVIDLITAKRFKVDDQTEYQEFAQFVKTNRNQNSDPISDDNLKTILEDIKTAEQKRKEEDRFADERKLRRAQDALRGAIRDLEPPVGVDETWENVKPRISNTEEYLRLGTEELRKEAFTKYIRRLQEKISEREKERERDARDRGRERDRVREREERRRKEPRDPRESRDPRSSRYDPGTAPPRQESQPPPAPAYYGNPYYDDRGGGMGGGGAGVLDY